MRSKGISSRNPEPAAVSTKRKILRGLRSAWLLAIFVALLMVSWWSEVPRHWLRTLADRALRQYDAHDALVWIDRSGRYYPKDVGLDLLAARANLQLNMNTVAIECLDRAQAKGAHPEELEPYRLMAEAQRGNEVAAEKLFGQTGVGSEVYEALIRANEYGNHGNRANHILDQMEQVGVSPLVVLYHRGRMREISEDFDGAVRFYCEAYRQKPSSSRSAFRAGVCYYNLRDFNRSEEMFSKVQSGPYKDVFAIERANCLWEKNSFEQAARTIEPILEITPAQLLTLYFQLDEFVDSDRAALIAARIEDAQGHSERAVLLLTRVLAFNHREFDARGLLIKNLRVLGRTREADDVTAVQSLMIANRQRCRQLRQELDSNPGDIARRCELAELYWYAESEAEAMLAISEILKMEPECERALQLRDNIQSDRAGRRFPRSSTKRP